MRSQKKPSRIGHKLDLRLFVAGSGARSLRCIDKVKRACEKHAPGRYNLSIVDIYLRPEEATKCQVIAVPTLIRQFPQPVRIYVGDLGAPSELENRLTWLTGTR